MARICRIPAWNLPDHVQFWPLLREERWTRLIASRPGVRYE